MRDLLHQEENGQAWRFQVRKSMFAPVASGGVDLYIQKRQESGVFLTAELFGYGGFVRRFEIVPDAVRVAGQKFAESGA